jgi:hypothetical protein
LLQNAKVIVILTLLRTEIVKYLTSATVRIATKMARGHQKIQAQAKANEAAAKRKKQEGHSSADSKKTAAAGLKASCSVCKVRRDSKMHILWVI